MFQKSKTRGLSPVLINYLARCLRRSVVAGAILAIGIVSAPVGAQQGLSGLLGAAGGLGALGNNPQVRQILDQNAGAIGAGQRRDASPQAAPQQPRNDQFANKLPDLPKPIPGFENQALELRPFGERLMAGSGDSYATVLDIPVPGDYQIGPGDSIALQLFGKENRTYMLMVSREGSISLPDIGPVSVSGQTFESMSRTVLDKISKQKIGVEASITMGPLRTIQVFLVGDVQNPGTYTTHALTTVTNALLVAGGVRPSGSLRKLEVRRGGKTVTHLDLYSVLLRGDARADIRLQPGDVIFVPPVGPRVAVTGAVNRPAIYELLGEAQPDDVLQLAGGLLPTAFPAGARLERIAGTGNREITQLSLGSASASKVSLRSGDVLTIPATVREITHSVRLSGAVERPGNYAWREGMRMSDLISTPNLLRKSAWRLLSVVKRMDNETGAISFVPVSLTKSFRGKEVFPLMDGDEIVVLDKKDVEFLESANVQFVLAGRVPPRMGYFEEQLVPADLATKVEASLLQKQEKASSGMEGSVGTAAASNLELGQSGFSPRPDVIASSSDKSGKSTEPAANLVLVRDGSEQAGVSEATRLGERYRTRRDPNECQGLSDLSSIITQEGASRFRSAFLQTPESKVKSVLKVLSCPEIYNTHPELLPVVLENAVTIRGEVKVPGVVPVAPGTSLASVVQVAGGPSRTADERQVELSRQVIANGVSRVERLIVPLTQTGNEVAPGDIVVVRKRFSEQDSGVIKITGEVRNPGVFDIRRGEKLSEALARAGGLNDHAYPYGAVFQRARVKEEKRSYYERASLELQNMMMLTLSRQRRAGGTGDTTAIAAMQNMIQDLKKVEPSGRMVVEADPIVLQLNPELDVVLEPGDELFVPKRPSHIAVVGEVLNPGAVQFRSGLVAGDYIRAAGGVSRTGDDERTYMILPNGSAEPLRVASWNSQPTPVPPGSVIYIPRDPLPIDSMALIETGLSIAKDIALTAASLASINR